MIAPPSTRIKAHARPVKTNGECNQQVGMLNGVMDSRDLLDALVEKTSHELCGISGSNENSSLSTWPQGGYIQKPVTRKGGIPGP